MKAEGRPSELAIMLAALGPRGTDLDGWRTAAEIRNRLVDLFGFDVTTQGLANRLRSMSRADAPWVEQRRAPWASDNHAVREYRVTRCGITGIENKLPVLGRAWYL